MRERGELSGRAVRKGAGCLYDIYTAGASYTGRIQHQITPDNSRMVTNGNYPVVRVIRRKRVPFSLSPVYIRYEWPRLGTSEYPQRPKIGVRKVRNFPTRHDIGKILWPRLTRLKDKLIIDKSLVGYSAHSNVGNIVYIGLA